MRSYIAVFANISSNFTTYYSTSTLLRMTIHWPQESRDHRQMFQITTSLLLLPGRVTAPPPPPGTSLSCVRMSSCPSQSSLAVNSSCSTSFNMMEMSAVSPLLVCRGWRSRSWLFIWILMRKQFLQDNLICWSRHTYILFIFFCVWINKTYNLVQECYIFK